MNTNSTTETLFALDNCSSHIQLALMNRNRSIIENTENNITTDNLYEAVFTLSLHDSSSFVKSTIRETQNNLCILSEQLKSKDKKLGRIITSLMSKIWGISNKYNQRVNKSQLSEGESQRIIRIIIDRIESTKRVIESTSD